MLPEVTREATVVVCEDDEPTLELLCDHLDAERFATLPAPCAADALRLCHYKQPDLLLLDLRLPDAAGLDVLREVRASDGITGRYDPGLPVIVVSGRATDADRVRGLVCGADDYVVKPFHLPELTERMRAVLRRRGDRREGPVRAGDIVVDPVRREVTVAGRPVSLANKEFACSIEDIPANQHCRAHQLSTGSTPGSTPCTPHAREPLRPGAESRAAASSRGQASDGAKPAGCARIAGLITRRSWVQIPPPLCREPLEIRGFSRSPAWFRPAPSSQSRPISSAGSTVAADFRGSRKPDLQGRSTGEIAAALVVEATTVKTHVKRVLAKLAARNRALAVIIAYAWGIVAPGSRSSGERGRGQL